MPAAAPAPPLDDPRVRRWLWAAILLVGTAIRLHGIGSHWLNPDEGGYYAVATLASGRTFWGVLLGREGEIWGNAHPPLFYLVLRALAPWAASHPLLLRLPSLVFGVLAIDATGRLTGRLAGSTAGLVAGALVALAPGLVIQSQVVRQYTMQLALLGYGAWLLLRYVDGGRARDAAVAGALLAAAVLTQFSSVVVLAALGGWIGWAAVVRRLPPARTAACAAALAPAALAFAVLYVVQIVPLEGTALQEGARVRFAHLMQADLAGEWSSLVGLLHYVFGPRLGALAGVLFVAGLLAAVRRRAAALLVLTLGALGLAGALAWLQRYPFGASRHSVYLAVFLVPCVAEGLRWLLARPLPRSVAVAAALAAIALFPGPVRSALRTPPLRIDLEKVAPLPVAERHVALLAAARRDGTVVVMDRQTYFTLAPALEPADALRFHGGVARLSAAGGDVLVADTWVLSTSPRAAAAPDHLPGFLRAAARACPDLRLSERRDGLLLFAGWNVALFRSLPELDRERDADGPCFHDLRVGAGFGSARLDLACWLGNGAAGAGGNGAR